MLTLPVRTLTHRRPGESRSLIATKHGKGIIGGRLRVGLLLQSLTFGNISKSKLRSPICGFRRTKRPSPNKSTCPRRSILLKFGLYSSAYFYAVGACLAMDRFSLLSTAITSTDAPLGASEQGAQKRRRLPDVSSSCAAMENPQEELLLSRVSGEPLNDLALGLWEESRKLPIALKASMITSSLQANAVTFVIGETGSGKTTQVPQLATMLVRTESIRSGNRMGQVVVGMPTVIGTRSLFDRVCREAGVSAGHFASYRTGDYCEGSIRSALSFMTHGYLFCAFESILPHIAVLILDETQHRTKQLSLLYPMVKRALAQRDCTLRVVLMEWTYQWTSMLWASTSARIMGSFACQGEHMELNATSASAYQVFLPSTRR